MALPIEDEEVGHTIPVEVSGGELRSGESSRPRIVKGCAVSSEDRYGVPAPQFRQALPRQGVTQGQSEQKGEEMESHQREYLVNEGG